MASLILLFSELVWNQEWDSTALLATNINATATLKDRVRDIQKQNTLHKSSLEAVNFADNPLESRVCVDFVWP